MTSLNDIFHNIADHTETLLRVLRQGGVAADVEARLMEHIQFEEEENTAKLMVLHEEQPSAITRKLLDHSFFIQRMTEDGSMPAELKVELLDHFMEEHVEWRVELGTNPETPGWTVGPMWP